MTLADLMLNVKRDSSRWAKDKSASAFERQDGYFAFSIGESGAAALREHIAGQKEHHKAVDFKDEVRALCRRYGVEIDERHVWE